MSVGSTTTSSPSARSMWHAPDAGNSTRSIRFAQSALILIEPIHILTDPGQFLGSHARAPQQTDCIGFSEIAALIGSFGFGVTMFLLDVLLNHIVTIRRDGMDLASDNIHSRYLRPSKPQNSLWYLR